MSKKHSVGHNVSVLTFVNYYLISLAGKQL